MPDDSQSQNLLYPNQYTRMYILVWRMRLVFLSFVLGTALMFSEGQAGVYLNRRGESIEFIYRVIQKSVPEPSSSGAACNILFIQNLPQKRSH